MRAMTACLVSHFLITTPIHTSKLHQAFAEVKCFFENF
jgi:hypothetical protein